MKHPVWKKDSSTVGRNFIDPWSRESICDMCVCKSGSKIQTISCTRQDICKNKFKIVIFLMNIIANVPSVVN